MKLSELIEAYRRMKNDPRWIRANKDGKDDKGTPYKRGDEILYFPLEKSVFVGKAADYEWSEFMKSAVDESKSTTEMERAGMKKIPIGSKGESVLKDMVKRGFLFSPNGISNEDRIFYYAFTTLKGSYLNEKNPKLKELVYKYLHGELGRHSNIVFEAGYTAYLISLEVDDMKRNKEEIPNAYDLTKEHFKSFGMRTDGNRVFDMAMDKLSKWMKKSGLSEGTSYERDLDEKEPVIVMGVKGMKSTPFRKKFKNYKEAEKWMDKNDGDYEIERVMNESADSLYLLKRKAELLKLADTLAKHKKEVYGGSDITQPKSSGEKKLDKEVADIYSRINTLVKGIRKGSIREAGENFIGIAVVKKNTRAKDLDSGDQEPIFTHNILPIYRKEGGAFIVKSPMTGNSLKVQAGNLVVKMKKDFDEDRWNKLIAKHG